MADTFEDNTGDDSLFDRREGKLRRKQERALRRTRKTAKKNLKRALETESDRIALEVEGENKRHIT